MPYEEIRHTADLSIRVHAQDLPSLFVEAAKGMNDISGMRLDPQFRIRQSIELSAIDNESLLVSFLSELVFLAENKKVGFDMFNVDIFGMDLHASISGGRITSIKKTIKAVTFHNLKINQIEKSLEVELVFDI